jgi:dTDP-4-dehydrorhamnose reductase
LEALRAAVRSAKPSVIINAAAYTAVDRAEAEPELAARINAEAPQVLAIEAERLGASLIHYSTDYVFDGTGSRPWTEGDPESPINTYGRTKLEGERRVAAACTRHFIFRTSWVYSAAGSNFIRTILRAARERPRLEVVDDQIGAPTGAKLIAAVTAQVIERRAEIAAGTYHLAAGGAVSWFEYANYILECAHQSRPQCKLARDILPVPSSSRPSPAARPRNSRLNTSKLEAALGGALPPWQLGVGEVVEAIMSETLP